MGSPLLNWVAGSGSAASSLQGLGVLLKVVGVAMMADRPHRAGEDQQFFANDAFPSPFLALPLVPFRPP